MHGTGRVVARLAKMVEHALAPAELSLAQYRLLVFLSRGAEAAGVLAGKLEVSPPSVTALVDGLVARGLVERRADSADRRRVEHVLTARGREVLAAAEEGVEQALARLCGLLPDGDDQRAVEGLALWAQALDLAQRARNRR